MIKNINPEAIVRDKKTKRKISTISGHDCTTKFTVSRVDQVYIIYKKVSLWRGYYVEVSCMPATAKMVSIHHTSRVWCKEELASSRNSECWCDHSEGFPHTTFENEYDGNRKKNCNETPPNDSWLTYKVRDVCSADKTRKHRKCDSCTHRDIEKI